MYAVAWRLYKSRFIFPDELTGALDEVGGAQSQFGLLSVTLNLGTSDGATLALEYDKHIRIFSRDPTRARRKDGDSPTVLIEAQYLIKASRTGTPTRKTNSKEMESTRANGNTPGIPTRNEKLAEPSWLRKQDEKGPQRRR